MSDAPRLGPVSFRGVTTKLPPKPTPQPPATPPPADQEPPPRASEAQHTSDAPAPHAVSPTPAREPVGERSMQRAALRPTRRNPRPDPANPDLVGSAQLHCRMPSELVQWLNSSPYANRAQLMLALALYGDQVKPNNDPIVVSRRRLNLPVRPPNRRH